MAVHEKDGRVGLAKGDRRTFFGPGRRRREAKGTLSPQPKSAKGFAVPKKDEKISVAFCVLVSGGGGGGGERGHVARGAIKNLLRESRRLSLSRLV